MTENENTSSNTTGKQHREGGVTGKGFVKGDKRINRNGRPKSFDTLRALALEIANHEVKGEKGTTLTIAEGIMRQWATSKNPVLQMKFIEVAYGKVPDIGKHELILPEGSYKIHVKKQKNA